MGVNFNQYCVLGFSIYHDETLVIDEEAVYEEQPRYDPKTGKVTHHEKILVQNEVSHHEYGNFRIDDWWLLENEIVQHYKEQNIQLSCIEHDEDALCIGIKIGYRRDFGRADLIDDCISFNTLKAHFETMQKLFPEEDIALYFIPMVG